MTDEPSPDSDTVHLPSGRHLPMAEPTSRNRWLLPVLAAGALLAAICFVLVLAAVFG